MLKPLIETGQPLQPTLLNLFTEIATNKLTNPIIGIQMTQNQMKQDLPSFQLVRFLDFIRGSVKIPFFFMKQFTILKTSSIWFELFHYGAVQFN